MCPTNIIFFLRFFVVDVTQTLGSEREGGRGGSEGGKGNYMQGTYLCNVFNRIKIQNCVFCRMGKGEGGAFHPGIGYGAKQSFPLGYR